MMLGKTNKKIRRRIQQSKHFAAVLALSQMRRPGFIRSRQAVSIVVSNMILIAAVIGVGFVVLAYTNSQSNSYVTQYGQTINSDIDKLSEIVAFEHASYNSGTKNLTVYFMNAGSINNLNITKAYLGTNQNPIDVTTMYYFNGVATQTLSVHQEAYIVLQDLTLVRGSSYLIKLQTWRGSTFEYQFEA